MKRKLIALSAAFCLVMSSCTMKEDTSEHTTATTPLTLTESITEEKPFIPGPDDEEKEPAPKIILALYDPFSHVPKPDDTTMRELSEAVEAIGDARAFLYANSTGFYNPTSEYKETYADESNVLEHSDEFEYNFCPVDPKYAANEEELFDRIREIFTENYISDDELRETLFAPTSHDGQPSYKTIDGVLCMKCQYNGVMTKLYSDKVTVLSYDENHAEIVAYGSSAADPPSHVYMTLKKSESGVWQLDKYEPKDYFENEADLLYNAVVLNSEKLNEILDGGNTPDDPLTIEVDGVTYIETDLDMTIDEMNEFFEDIFFVYRLKQNPDEFDPYESFIDGDLLEEYRNKYIDWVYYEQDGVLFRKSDAPKWYLPELKIDPYSKEIRSAGGSIVSLFGMNGGEFFIWEQPFYDESGESFTAEVTVCGKFAEEHDGYEFVRIAGRLPIMERTS